MGDGLPLGPGPLALLPVVKAQLLGQGNATTQLLEMVVSVVLDSILRVQTVFYDNAQVSTVYESCIQV